MFWNLPPARPFRFDWDGKATALVQRCLGGIATLTSSSSVNGGPAVHRAEAAIRAVYDPTIDLVRAGDSSSAAATPIAGSLGAATGVLLDFGR